MTRRIEVSTDIATCLRLRREVFIDEQGVTEADEIDDLDEQSTHLIAFVDDAPAGTARITIQGGIAKIGRVCVLRPYRGTGLGADLICKALQVAKGKATTAKLGAQVHALQFYERLGFVATGPVYDDAGIDHRDMVRDL